MNADWTRTIKSVEPRQSGALFLLWSDGTATELAVPVKAEGAPELGDWGHSLVWPDGTELGADSLWLATLTAIGRDDARQFMEWRLANGLSLTRAAEELGLSRRTVAYYSNGTRPVPKAILLACKGWDATHRRRKAA
ncbi:helix-turn-helix transcriptional regulator [Novosphingobium sp.]|uniref:helix-turn-helix domain-containing protein n=1 Tax=Novosphingobium sp. TaxID=1874826 RepID=UPI0025D91F3D|nr:helix-turn-helix transcriptional regulator [Novosphingobium sp.]MCC6926324.1 helix-turn-helix transcriptional regulator [Novosphingobium sp.]